MYFSHKIGFKKPSLDSYRFVLNDIELEGNECIFIDDVSDNLDWYEGYYWQDLGDNSGIVQSFIDEDVSDGVEYTYSSENTYNSTSEMINIKSSQTVFKYGLGCNPTKNLQIDLLGFFNVRETTEPFDNFDNSDRSHESINILNTNFFENLRLSFTLKF